MDDGIPDKDQEGDKDMRKLIALALGLAFAASVYGDAAHYKQVSATATSKTVNLGALPAITIYNAGANEIYFRLFREGESPEAAVATADGGVYLAAGATLEYNGPSLYGAISIICDTAETATVHIYIP